MPDKAVEYSIKNSSQKKKKKKEEEEEFYSKGLKAKERNEDNLHWDKFKWDKQQQEYLPSYL